MTPAKVVPFFSQVDDLYLGFRPAADIQEANSFDSSEIDEK